MSPNPQDVFASAKNSCDDSNNHAIAFFMVWKHCQPTLYKVCLRHLGGRREEAEDALSRAMLIAWERLPQHVHAIRDIKAWLTRLTINLCIDIIRERKRHAAVFEALDDTYDLAHGQKAAIENPEELTLRNELSVYLSHSINGLPSKLRQPFLLRFIQEMSYVDISAQLNLSSDNTRKRIQQAKTILRTKLAKYRSSNGDIAKDNSYQDFRARLRS